MIIGHRLFGTCTITHIYILMISKKILWEILFTLIRKDFSITSKN